MISRGTIFTLALILAGCASTTPKPQPVQSYRSEGLSAAHRILVLPFAPESEFPDQADMVTARFVEAIRRGPFTILPLPDAALSTSLVEDVRLRGSVRTADLVTLQREYRVDAVVIGSITRYDPYAPQVLGLDVKMVSTRSGAILWQARKVFDATSEPIQTDALVWYDRIVIASGEEFGPEVVLLSPKAFARYACTRLAETMVTETKVAVR